MTERSPHRPLAGAFWGGEIVWVCHFIYLINYLHGAPHNAYALGPSDRAHCGRLCSLPFSLSISFFRALPSGHPWSPTFTLSIIIIFIFVLITIIAFSPSSFGFFLIFSPYLFHTNINLVRICGKNSITIINVCSFVVCVLRAACYMCGCVGFGDDLCLGLCYLSV